MPRRDFLKFSSFGLIALASSACTVLQNHIDDSSTLGMPQTSAGWVKSDSNPVLGGSLGTCFDVSVLRDGDVYRMWFSWRPKHAIALVESQDGIHWGEPIICMLPEPGVKEVNRPVVIKLSVGYYMWYTSQTSQNSWIDYANSPDGRKWSRVSGNPVLRADEPWEGPAVMSPHVIHDEASKLFRMWYSGGNQYEPVSIGYATSLDGIHWMKAQGNPVFVSDPANFWEKERVAACQVVPYNGWYIMFYIGFSDVNHAQIGLARSKDGIVNWQRHMDNPIIRPGGPGAWDGDSVYKPYSLLENDRWLLWYNGRQADREQIGLAIHDGADLGF